MTDALVSQLQFQKGKDGAELAWVDGQIAIRESGQDAKPVNSENEPMEGKYLYFNKSFIVCNCCYFSGS